MYVLLSHDITENTPCPAGLRPPKIKQVHNMDKGDPSNVYMLTLCNHIGTHIDGPSHFSKSKRKPLNQFALDNFIFDAPLLLDLPKDDGQMLQPADLAPHDDAIGECNLLLIRTGFGKIRQKDGKRYADKSPGFSAPAARYIADGFPKLRAMAIDTLSFACPQSLKEGIEAHRILLDECRRDIFLIEDVNLDLDLSGLKEVFVVPLFCERIDSAPCVVIANIKRGA